MGAAHSTEDPLEPEHYIIDPFLARPLLLSAFETRPLFWLLLVGPLMAGGAAVVAAFEGTLGSPQHFAPVADFMRAAGRRHDAAPIFPLFRDYPSAILLTVIALTAVLIPHQWRTIKNAIPGLVASGAARPLLEQPSGRDSLRVLADKANRQLSFRHLSHIAMLSALVLTLLLIAGLHIASHPFLFSVLAPGDLSPAATVEWQEATYRAWWASVENTGGLIFYTVIAWFGIYIILLQNYVGGVAVGVMRKLPYRAKLSVDPLNRDGRRGWKSVTDVWKTVYTSLLLHGTALVVVVMVLGWQNFFWVLVLVILWVVVVPAYTVLPRWWLGSAIKKGRDADIEETIAQAGGAVAHPGASRGAASLQNRDCLRREIAALQVHPFSTWRTRVQVFVVGVGALLPLGLGLARAVGS